jgi:2'-5' RNA ligase
MIRAFVGVRMDPEVSQKIAALQSNLRARIPSVRWVAQTNYHFTLKFLGAVAEDRIPFITSALRETLSSCAPFVVSARGIGVFPDIKRPSVIWVGLESQELATIAIRVEGALEAVGFARERRPFKGHLTLGRWREPVKLTDKPLHELERWREQPFGDMVVKELVLFQSTLKPGGAVYSELEVFPLGM